MLITLFTDAGFCHRTKLATWASWAKYNGKTIRASGIFKKEISSIDVGEIQAIINGIFKIIKEINPTPGSKIIAQTDSKNAIQLLEVGPSKKSLERKSITELRKFYKELVKEFVVEFRWVQSHKGTETPRNAVNSWCDSECTRLLKIAKEEKYPNLKLKN